MTAFALSLPVALRSSPPQLNRQIPSRRTLELRTAPPSRQAHLQCPRACEEPPSAETALTPFPTLYDAWFGPDHQLADQMRASVTAAVESGATSLELQWPAVPNLEEIAAGTLLNFEFGKMVAEDLGMSAPPDYAVIRRYLASFCNLYWVKQLASAAPFRDRTVWAVSTDAVSKARAQDSIGNVRLANLRDPPATAPGDVVVVIDPRFDEAWRKGARIKPEDGFVVFLNSQFNESYGLTGPRRGPLLRDVQVAYFLKRITRGYVFRAFPGPWRACLEKPDMGIEELRTYEEAPKLREAAAVVREESNARYGGFYNDRYVQGFGGRL